MTKIMIYSLFVMTWIFMFFYALVANDALLAFLSFIMMLIYSGRVVLLTLAFKEGKKID